MECDPFPVKTNDQNFQYNAGAWKCYDSGTQASCDTNEVITGICGSGSDDQCMDQCGSDKNTKYSFALRCAPIPDDIFLDSGDWETPQDSGVLYSCPSGQVACGACFSDSDPHCQGDHFRAKCCTPSSPLNITGNLGWWEYQYAISTDGGESITVGISNEQSHSKTQTWSDSVTASVSASLTVEGAGSFKESLSQTQSEGVSKTQSESWTQTETDEQTLTYTDEQIGYVVWQWKTAVTDNQGCDDFDDCTAGSKDYALTPDATYAPKCLPGYWLNGDVTYQTCEEGYYLPGYEPSSAPTMMPSSSPSEVPSSSPSSFPTEAPATSAPTAASTTQSPTAPSTTQSPSESPTSPPTASFSTQSPTADVTTAPTSASTTSAPTSEGTTVAPTSTSAPTSATTTVAPTSGSPTESPTIEASTTASPTQASTTVAPTAAIATPGPTQSPTAESDSTPSPTSAHTAVPTSIIHGEGDGETIIIYNYGTIDNENIGRKRNLRGSKQDTKANKN